MSALTDFIFQFQQRILGRYTNKTAPLSILKTDHSNSFNELSNALLLLVQTDNAKTIVFTNVSTLSVDWLSDSPPAPDDTYTYAQLFGNEPIFAVQLNNGDNTYSGLKEFGETRTKELDQITLIGVLFNFGVFPQTGEVIIR